MSDGERYLTLDAQLERARELVAAGADLIDVGGESGRTDRAAVSEDDEIARVLPLVEALAADGVLVSVDTWKPRVARAVVDAGASMLNDVSGLARARARVDRRGVGRGARAHAHARGAQGGDTSPATTTRSRTWSRCCAA